MTKHKLPENYTTPPEDPVVSAMRARRHDPDIAHLPLDKIYRELFDAGWHVWNLVIEENLAKLDEPLEEDEEKLRKSRKRAAKKKRASAPPSPSESPPKTPVVKHPPEKIARVLDMLGGGQHTNVVAMACGLSAAAVRGIWRRHGGKKV